MTSRFRLAASLAAVFLTIQPAAGELIVDPVFAAWRAKVDPAVEEALGWLQRVQQQDGSFPEQYGDSTGIPALAGMAFLSKGHLPTEGPYANALNRCIDFILANQKPDGLFEKGNAGSGPMYAHNIATLFLAEVSGMVDPTRQTRIDAALPKALALILRAQAVKKDEQNQGGWRYHPGSQDSDTSCSGWALMALRSAKLNGAGVPDQAIRDAVGYLHRHQDEKDGRFGYSNRDDHAVSLTGMGLLCLELCGEHGSERTTLAADWVLRHFRELAGGQFEFYGNYYNAQAMFQIGGRHWQEYADWMYTSYLPKQEPGGSWQSREAGRVYGTTMMVLAFTVPWRQLPIYQRDETVDEELEN
ncbi:MAG: terpene cyclase/mutase family protein [Akkermansiaceae bacterium]|nr:terpene cyclase/mutase family protein [Akkermansiaceae bacterium]